MICAGTLKFSVCSFLRSALYSSDIQILPRVSTFQKDLIYALKLQLADPGGSVGLRPLACWDCGCESHRGMDMSVVSAVCCQVEVSATGRSLVQRSPTDCVCVTECDKVQQ